MEDVQKKVQTDPAKEPMACIERLRDAINTHSVDAMAECFDPDYESSFPVHLDRAFRGHAQMRKNWTQIFGAVPDIHATIVSACSNGDVAWGEWDWQGTRVDGEPYHMRGVTIQSVQQGRIAWTRLYIEPVQEAGPGSDVAVRDSVMASDDRR